MNVFHRLTVTALIVALSTNFVWFALTYFVYIQTQSVVSTGLAAGIYLVIVALSGFWFGSFVDRNKKKTAMFASSIASLIFFTVGFLMYIFAPSGAFSSVTSPYLWIFASILLSGVIAGLIYFIAIPTLITSLVPENRRDKANGLFSTATGFSFGVNSVASGIVLGFGGMFWVLVGGIVLTLLGIVYLAFIPVSEQKPSKSEVEKQEKNEVSGTINLIKSIPGLFGLIFFSTFNNLLGGVFFALMDAYGLELMSVQFWGILWGVLSPAFVIGGLVIARKGLGKNPLRTLFLANIILWSNAVFFAIQPSIILLSIGITIWLGLFPVIQASEQTIIQKVVAQNFQGRVFGFSRSIEQSVAPLTAFIIGPIAQLIFIPFMTTGSGVQLIGGWFGTGAGRGIALVFIIAGIIGLVVTLFAMRSKIYKLLAKRYLE
jgi:DHA3 family multidrug efflux protein-like MFS transporter